MLYVCIKSEAVYEWLKAFSEYTQCLKVTQTEPTGGAGSIINAQLKIHLVFRLKIDKPQSVLRSAGQEGWFI